MKNKKVVFLFVIVLLCSSYDVLAQSITEISQKREARYGVEYANYWRNDEVCDTLFLEDGTFFFYCVPLFAIYRDTQRCSKKPIICMILKLCLRRLRIILTCLSIKSNLTLGSSSKDTNAPWSLD